MNSSMQSTLDITTDRVSVQGAEAGYYVPSRACHQRPVWHRGCLANDSAIQWFSVGQPKCTQTNIECEPIQEFKPRGAAKASVHVLQKLLLDTCRVCTTIPECWWLIQVNQAGHTAKPPIASMNKNTNDTNNMIAYHLFPVDAFISVLTPTVFGTFFIHWLKTAGKRPEDKSQ